MANSHFEMDITRWQAKAKNVLEAQARVVQTVVSWALEQVRDEAINNINGPKYGYTIKKSASGKEHTVPNRGMMTNSGAFPVPIITGFLKKSIKIMRINTVFGAVYSDNSVANYNRHVHFGTKKMKPRPFLQAAVDKKRPEIESKFQVEIYKEINKAGRA